MKHEVWHFFALETISFFVYCCFPKKFKQKNQNTFSQKWLKSFRIFGGGKIRYQCIEVAHSDVYTSPENMIQVCTLILPPLHFFISYRSLNCHSLSHFWENVFWFFSLICFRKLFDWKLFMGKSLFQKKKKNRNDSLTCVPPYCVDLWSHYHRAQSSTIGFLFQRAPTKKQTNHINFPLFAVKVRLIIHHFESLLLWWKLKYNSFS